MAENGLTSEQRDALAAVTAARGPCPAAETLVEYEALPDIARARHSVHAHVQVCSRCQLVLLHLEEPAVQSPRSLVRWALPLAAALAIAILGPVLYRSVPTEPTVETIRGSELQPVAPVGPVVDMTAFEWQTPIRAAKYRVTVFRGSQVVWVGEAVDTRVAPPDTVSFERGVGYEWQVDAVDAEGSVRLSSPRTGFSLMRRSPRSYAPIGHRPPVGTRYGPTAIPSRAIEWPRCI